MFNPFKKKKREKLFNPDEERVVTKHGRTQEGGELTYVSQEKYPMRGDPKFGALMALKPVKAIFNKIIMGRLANLIPWDRPNNQLSEPVREIARIFDLLIDAERLGGMKSQWKAWKKVICVFLEHDLAYRYRFQWVLERIDSKKIALTNGDKYFMRVKNFWVDLEEEEKEARKIVGDKFDEFKKWLATEKNWFKEDKDKYKDMAVLAKEFIINQKI